MSSERPNARRAKPPVALWIIGGAVWCLLPVLLIAFLWAKSSQLVDAEAPRAWAPIFLNSAPIDRPVSVEITWRPDVDVIAPAWAGLVTSVEFTAGSTVTSGSTILSIDDVGRLALHTPRPFFRQLSNGMTGDDVLMLNEVLADLGFRHGDSSRYTTATTAGVRQLAEALGVPQASSARTFDPGWVIYLPAGSVKVGDSRIQVGVPAPAAGSAIFEAAGGVSSARLIEPVGVSGTAEVSPDPSPTKSPTIPSAPEVQPIAAGPQEQLVLGGRLIPLAEDRQAVAEAGLLTIEELVDPDEPIVSGALRSEPDGETWTVPSAALVQNSSGVCLVVDRGADASPVGIEVGVVGSRIGVTIVRGALKRADRVLIAPSTGEARGCPSA